MGENSKIEWTDHNFNPWVGCTKVSPSCDHCYAEAWSKRSGLVQWAIIRGAEHLEAIGKSRSNGMTKRGRLRESTAIDRAYFALRLPTYSIIRPIQHGAKSYLR